MSENEKKELANALKEINAISEGVLPGVGESDLSGTAESEMGSEFRPVGTNLPEKPSAWTKLKNALFYEIKVELTPRQQKIEDEINEFLHQEITWQSFKSFLFREVPITYKGKRVF